MVGVGVRLFDFFLGLNLNDGGLVGIKFGGGVMLVLIFFKLL